MMHGQRNIKLGYMSFAQASIYLRLPLYSERFILSECVGFYVLLILFASNSELYAANTTINADPV